MEKIFENVTRITTKDEYGLLKSHAESLLHEATVGGYLADPGADNEYTRELGRLACLGGDYEAEFMTFSFRKPKTPLVREIEAEMAKRGLHQKEAAMILGVNVPTFSRMLRGQYSITMSVAKRLYEEFNIDPKIILKYS